MINTCTLYMESYIYASMNIENILKIEKIQPFYTEFSIYEETGHKREVQSSQECIMNRYWSHKCRPITRKGGSSSASFPAHSRAVREAISRSISWDKSMGRDSPLLRKQPSNSSSFMPGCLNALCRIPGLVSLWNSEWSRTGWDFFPYVWCIEPRLCNHKIKVLLSSVVERIDSQSRLSSQVPDSL